MKKRERSDRKKLANTRTRTHNAIVLYLYVIRLHTKTARKTKSLHENVMQKRDDYVKLSRISRHSLTHSLTHLQTGKHANRQTRYIVGLQSTIDWQT